MTSQYCDELVNDFNSLVDDLTPTPEFYKEARQVAHEIVEQLKQNASQCDVKIGRTIVAGSIGKGTAIFYYGKNGKIRYPDLDLVVFINDREPPFGDVYDIFEEILEPLNVKNLRQSQISLQFDIKTESHGYLSVDLLAAENEVVNTRAYRDCDIGEVQANMTSLILNTDQKNADNKLRSSAFAEKTVRIIKDFVKDDFVLEVVYLAKNWMRSVDLSGYGYIPAKSAIAEAIAIDAQRTKPDRRTCLISGFRRFLKLMENFQKLDIRLNGDNETDVEDSLPWIQDPGNSSNNLAKGMPQEAMAALEQQATNTLEMLEQVGNEEGYCDNANAIDAIFKHKTQSWLDFFANLVIILAMMYVIFNKTSERHLDTHHIKLDN